MCVYEGVCVFPWDIFAASLWYLNIVNSKPQFTRKTCLCVFLLWESLEIIEIYYLRRLFYNCATFIKVTYVYITLWMILLYRLWASGSKHFNSRLVKTHRYVKKHSIIMLMKYSDLSQSDRSNWVMWQVKDPCPRPGWDECLTREKMAFIKSVKTCIILLSIWLHL